MDILNNPYVGLAFFAILITGIVLVCQKDTLTDTKKGLRGVGWLFISVSITAALYRLYVFSLVEGSKYVYSSIRRNLSGGERCTGPNSSPSCTVKKINYSSFEKFLSVIGLDVFAQSMAKSRFLKMGNDFIPGAY